MKILMTGGGTGGHVYPAIAIANTIKQNISGCEIAFVGTKKGIENKICKNEGYPMYHVEVMGIRRSLSPRNIKAAYLALTSPIKARKIINEYTEPRMRGMDRNKRSVTLYMGCLTMPYNPVSTTV